MHAYLPISVYFLTFSNSPKLNDNDNDGNSVCNAIVGAMKSGYRPFLFLCTMGRQKYIIQLQQIFPTTLWHGIQHDRVLLLVTNSPPYIIKART